MLQLKISEDESVLYADRRGAKASRTEKRVYCEGVQPSPANQVDLRRIITRPDRIRPNLSMNARTSTEYIYFSPKSFRFQLAKEGQERDTKKGLILHPGQGAHTHTAQIKTKLRQRTYRANREEPIKTAGTLLTMPGPAF